MKAVVILVCLILSGCTARLRQTTDAQIFLDPIASWFGHGVSGKQITPIKRQTSVTAANGGEWFN